MSDLLDSLSDQSMRYGSVRLAVPPGFQNIIRLISHEVLREQPKDSICFIADFLQDVLKIRDATGYDPVLQGELIERVQAQYNQLRKDRAALAEQQAKRPIPQEGGEVGSKAGGDIAPATKKQATETVSTLVHDVIKNVEETTVSQGDGEVMEKVPQDAQGAPQGDEEAPLDSQATPLENEAAQGDTTEEQAAEDMPPGDTEEVADGPQPPSELIQEPAETAQEPVETAPEPAEPAQEPSTTEEEPSGTTGNPSEAT